MPDFSNLRKPFYWKVADLGGVAVNNVQQLRDLVNTDSTITTGADARTCTGVTTQPVGSDTKVKFNFDGQLTTPTQTDALTAILAPGSYSYTPPATGTMLEAYITDSTTSFEDSWQDVDWDVQSFSNTNLFAHTLGESDIAFQRAGNFVVDVRITADNPTTVRADVLAALYIDTGGGSGYEQVPGSNAYSYHRTGITGKCSLNIHKAIAVTAGDSLVVRVIRNSGSAIMNLVTQACTVKVVRQD